MAKPNLEVTGATVFGGTVTVSTTVKEPKKPYTYLMARIEAYQDGDLVYRQYQQFPDGNAGDSYPFTLGPTSLWQGGAADGEVSVGEFNGTYRAKVKTFVTIAG